MRALILAAGFGTRLRPLTENHAKPALPVVGVPGFWYGAWHLSRTLKVREFAINLCHAPQSVIDAASDADLRKITGATFHFSDESKGILGSSGALKQLVDWVGRETLAVLNGDSISLPSWERMLEAHRKSGALLTMHVRKFADEAESYTDIAVSGSGKVAELRDKASRGVMFDGAYLIEPQCIARLPKGKSELRPSLLEPLINEGKLYAFREDIELIDMGTVASYARAQFDLLKRMPALRPLVEVKMREEFNGCWVPKDWKVNAGRPGLRAPVVVSGPQEQWASTAAVLGPNFVGVFPPMPGVRLTGRDELVFSNHVEKLQ